MGRLRREKAPKYSDIVNAYEKQATHVLQNHLREAAQQGNTIKLPAARQAGMQEALAELIIRYCAQRSSDSKYTDLSKFVHSRRALAPEAFFQELYERINEDQDLSNDVELNAITDALNSVAKEYRTTIHFQPEFVYKKGMTNVTISRRIQREFQHFTVAVLNKVKGLADELMQQDSGLDPKHATARALVQQSQALFSDYWEKSGKQKSAKYDDGDYDRLKTAAGDKKYTKMPQVYFSHLHEVINSTPRIMRDPEVRELYSAIRAAAQALDMKFELPELRSRSDLSLIERGTIAASAVKGKANKTISQAKQGIESAKQRAEEAKQRTEATKSAKKESIQSSHPPKPTTWEDLTANIQQLAKDYIQTRYHGVTHEKSVRDAARHLLTAHYWRNRNDPNIESLRHFLVSTKSDSAAEFFNAFQNVVQKTDALANDRQVCAIASAMNEVIYRHNFSLENPDEQLPITMDLRIKQDVVLGIDQKPKKDTPMVKKAKAAAKKGKQAAKSGMRKIKTWRREKRYDKMLKQLRESYDDLSQKGSMTGTDGFKDQAMIIAIKNLLSDYKGTKSDLVSAALNTAESIRNEGRADHGLKEYLNTITTVIAEQRDLPPDPKGDLGTLLRAVSKVLHDNQNAINVTVSSKKPENFMQEMVSKAISQRIIQQQDNKPQAS